MRYRHFLAATDFSPLGDLAVEHAAMLALDAGARLTVVHVLPEPTPPSPLLPHYAAPVDEATKEKARADALDALKARIPDEARDIDVRFEVRVGDPSDEILTAARQTEPDCIVVATQGRRGFTRFVFGSVAERVLRLAECDVLSVRPTRDDPRRGNDPVA